MRMIPLPSESWRRTARVAITFRCIWDAPNYERITETCQVGCCSSSDTPIAMMIFWPSLLATVLTLLSQAEYDESNPSEFYGPNDLRIGETVFIFGRRFLLTDCDFATRRYYAEVLKDPQPDRVTMQQPQRLRPQTVWNVRTTRYCNR